MTHQRAVHENTSELIAADGVRLFARTWEAAGPLLGNVGIVHGLGEHSGRYVHVAEMLAEAGYRVLAYDQRGHGKSPGRRGDVSDYALLLNDVHALQNRLERESHGKPLFLLGHSFGGSILLNYALRNKTQVSGLIVTSPLLRLTQAPPAWKSITCRMLRYLWPTARFPTGTDVAELSRDEDSIDAYLRDPLVHSVISARLGIQMLAAGQWALDHAQELRLPLLLMHGSADPVTSPDACRQFAAKAAPTCSLKIWDGLLHELQWEIERREVIRTMIDWLEHAGTAGDAPVTSDDLV